jgi:hypothetical protein
MAEPVLTNANPIYHETTEGGVRYSPASAHSKELAKWEMQPLPDGSVTQGMIDAARRAGVHQAGWDHPQYPRAMYKAEQTPNGIKLTDVSQSAQSEVEQRNLESRGYSTSATDALALVERQNFEVAEAAANRAFHDRRLSEPARREAEVLDASTARHLGEIPAAPIKKRGRRPASTAAVETA